MSAEAKLKQIQSIKAKSQLQKNVKAKLVEKAKLARETALQNRLENARKAREQLSLKREAKVEEKKKRDLNLGVARSKNVKVGRHDALMASSWIDDLSYDPVSKLLVAYIDGKKLGWQPIEEFVYDLWKSGLASCKTNDKSGKKRWWRGKNPSLGAMWHKNIKKHLAGKRVF